MQTITLDLPDIITNVYKKNEKVAKEEMQRGIVIWEYLCGHLSLEECGMILKTGYRGFMELLWSKGISIDALNEIELKKQVAQLESIMETE